MECALTAQDEEALERWSIDIAQRFKSDKLCSMLAEAMKTGVRWSEEHIARAKRETGCDISLDDVLFKYDVMADDARNKPQENPRRLKSADDVSRRAANMLKRYIALAKPYENLVLYKNYKK